jgi:tRNA(Arg) A34 adenosine deaminase TadA
MNKEKNERLKRMEHEKFMRHAIELSRDNMNANKGGPFGAVVVKDGEIIGKGANSVTSINDPTAHAEIVAIRNACETIDSYSLEGCEIYSSCEPCPMCLAAIYWSRIDKVYFANTHEDAAKVDFDDSFLYQQMKLTRDQRSLPSENLLRIEALQVFEEWDEKEDKIPY